MWLLVMTAPTFLRTFRTSCSFIISPPFLQNCCDFFRDFLRCVYGCADSRWWLRDRATDDQSCCAGLDRFRRSHNSFLVASGCPFGTNAGRDFQKTAELFLLSEKLELLWRTDDPVAASDFSVACQLQNLGLARSAENQMSVILLKRGKNRDSEDERLPLIGNSGHHRLNAC